MSGIIHGLNWFPAIPDKFVTWGSEINLCKIDPTDDRNVFFSAYNKEMTPKSPVVFLASDTRYQYIRCLKPSFNEEILVAVGLANGGVSLCTFNQNNENVIEFTPKQQRTCLCLAWNEVEKNLLAIGHDRNRSDFCITVWDTERGTPKDSSCFFGLSETAHSLCWDKSNKILAAGISQKNIKLFDLRQNSTNVATVTTRMVHGLCISPNNRYLASYVDSVVGLWDLRNLEKPLSQVQTLKNVTNLAWCPTRTTVLSTIQRDSPFLQLLNVFHADIDGSCEVLCTKRVMAPFQAKGYSTHKNSSIADMSWHFTDYERTLILSEAGTINDFRIPELTGVAWDISNNLWKSLESTGICKLVTKNIKDNAHVMEYTANDFKFSEDIALIMYERALNDYGLLSDIKKNGDLSQNNNLKALWNVLANMTRDDRLLGIKDVLEVNSTSDVTSILRSEPLPSQWPEYISSCHPLLIYKNDSRDLAQNLCGWTFENDEVLLNKFIPDLCNKKEFSRAAMICVFQLKIKHAIDILSKYADQSNDPSILRMAAIALSGFNADRCNLVLRNHRGHLQIHDSHLRALFGFLTSENENYESVVMEKGVSLGDRLAFACKYLSDTKLVDYVKVMIHTCTETADLHGLLLTGESNDGINLLQSYLDWTQDVQTVSLISIRFLHHDIFSEYRVQFWIASYLDLLDTWNLWEKRAELEIKMENTRSPTKPTRSVFLLCNFCGKSVSAALHEEARIRNASSNLNKLSSCPNCRKPLPRCSLCLLHMGTSNFLHNTPGHESLGWQSKPFSKWFSWCQTCRHGGHTEHLMQWFSQNFECPVTACSCKCFTMDITPRKIVHDSS